MGSSIPPITFNHYNPYHPPATHHFQSRHDALRHKLLDFKSANVRRLNVSDFCIESNPKIKFDVGLFTAEG